ncbi:MAG: hypothetical protein NTX08_08520 [Sphingobacteriales bacterium]|nr:hypothetical protein [Sphingobacteriales bacterium]
MSKFPYRQDREELRALLQQFDNLRAGRSHSFIDEDSFERIIDYYDEKEQLPQALVAADYAVEQYPYSSSLLLKKADVLIALRRYQEALDILDKANLLDSKDTNLYILKTDAYLALDMQQKAAAVLESALDDFEGEEKIDLLFELADVYDDYENFEKVFDCLKMILQQEPSNEEALYKICFWTDFTGRNEEGIKLHQHIIEDFPFNELAWFNLGAAYQGIKNEGIWDSAIKSLEQAMRIHRLQPEYNLAMGQCFMELDKLDDAITYFGNVVRVRPKKLSGWIELLKCLYKAEMYEEALEYSGFAFEQTDNKPIFLFYKSAVLYAMGKSKEALIQLEAGMARNPKLIKKFIELNPSILQHQQVVDIIARFKKRRSF